MMSAETTDAAPDLNVDLNALWLLQALLGIPKLAPELRALPYGAARSDDWLVDPPGVAVLREQGLVDDAGQVLDKFSSRLQVLAFPDVEVALLISRDGPLMPVPILLDDPSTWRAIPDNQLRIVLARRDNGWVSAARAGEHFTIDDVGGGVGIEWLAALPTGQLDAWHCIGPSRIPALNVAVEDLMAIAAERAATPADAVGRDASLRTLGVGGAALAELAEVIDHPVAEAVMYARGHVDDELRTGQTVLDVRDTEAGRVALYQMAAVRGSGQDWMTIAPGTTAQLEQGVRSVLASVDVANWDTHQRM